MNMPSNNPRTNASHWISPGGSRRQEKSRTAPTKLASNQKILFKRVEGHGLRGLLLGKPSGIKQVIKDDQAQPRLGGKHDVAQHLDDALGLLHRLRLLWDQEPAQAFKLFQVEMFHRQAVSVGRR